MSALDVVFLLAAGFAAGTINSVVGSGSLITFPTLLALGYPALTANVTNTVGLVPGAISSVVGYRRELRGQRARLPITGAVAAAGGITGAVLLLVLPSSVFDGVVPVLILLACGLVVVQPRLARWLNQRSDREARTRIGPVLLVGVYLTGIYGGYFGAAQGVILLALLAILLTDDLQSLNGLKNWIAMLVNGTAAVLLIATEDVVWGAAVSIAVGAAAGAQLGATFGRRLPAPLLRAIIVVVGLAAVIALVL